MAMPLRHDALVADSTEKEVDGFLLQEILGSGGMGVVYRAVGRADGAEAAIKLMPFALAHDKQRAELFRREARVASLVRHENLVKVDSFGELPDGTMFLRMELLQGETLRSCEERRDPRLTPRRVVDVAAQLAKALTALHAKDIIHRDLKPSNVMLVPGENGWQVKLLDFGIARTLSESDDLTGTGQGFGTARYMSPEQCKGARKVSTAVDLYSLGILLFEALTGSHPLQPAGDGTAEMRELHIQQPALSLQTLWPGAPTELVTLLAQLLHKNPAQRPTAEQTGQRLEAIRKLVDDEPLSLETTAATRGADATDPPQAPDLGEYLGGNKAQADALQPSEQRSGLAPQKPPAPAWRRPMVQWLLVASGIVGLVSLSVGLNRMGLHWGGLQRQGERVPERRGLNPSEFDRLPLPNQNPTPPPGMVYIAGGTFTQGRLPAQIDVEYADCVALEKTCDKDLFQRESNPRQVRISPFFLHKTEVTNSDFVRWLNRGTRVFEFGADQVLRMRDLDIVSFASDKSGIRKGSRGYEVKPGMDDLPVVAVTWHGARLFCSELGASLPTEAEFEYVASRHGMAPYPWGDKVPTCDDAVALGRDEDTGCPKGALPKVGTMALDVSPEGVHDLAGSVSEWVLDRFMQSYWSCDMCQDPIAPEDPHSDPKETYRIVRGGSYFESRVPARATFRSRAAELRNFDNIGFRCALRLPPLQKERP